MAAQLIPPGAPEFRARFTAFLADEPAPDEPAVAEWDAMIRRNAQAGRMQQRVHMITEPLTDSSELYLQHYDDAGEWLGTEPITAPAAIVRACRWRDAALHRATPWWDYLRNHHPELVQRVVAPSPASGRR